MIVRAGLGRETDAVSGFEKTPPVFSTDASKHQFVARVGVVDRRVEWRERSD
jgi:hypothetical protein